MTRRRSATGDIRNILPVEGEPMRHRRLPTLVTLVAALAACATTHGAASSLARVEHLVVIYQENWSFDGLFGKFPGANGIANASAASIAQTDRAGTPYATLPPSIDTRPEEHTSELQSRALTSYA